jgi:sarcosine oxidase/L-pipecolate oxidase
MKQKNSTGYDGVSSRILKYCKDKISKPLGHIFNVSLEQGVYPERMKYASLRPIYKTGEKSDMSNYRPISLFIAFLRCLKE